MFSAIITGFGYLDRGVEPHSVTFTGFRLPHSRQGFLLGNYYTALVTWIAAWSLSRLPLLGFGYPTLVRASFSVTIIRLWLPGSRIDPSLGNLYTPLVTRITNWRLFRLPLLGFGYPNRGVEPFSVTFTGFWLPYSRQCLLFGNLYRVLVTWITNWGLFRLLLHDFDYLDRHLEPLSVTFTGFWLTGSGTESSLGYLSGSLITGVALLLPSRDL